MYARAVSNKTTLYFSLMNRLSRARDTQPYPIAPRVRVSLDWWQWKMLRTHKGQKWGMFTIANPHMKQIQQPSGTVQPTRDKWVGSTTPEQQFGVVLRAPSCNKRRPCPSVNSPWKPSFLLVAPGLPCLRARHILGVASPSSTRPPRLPAPSSVSPFFRCLRRSSPYSSRRHRRLGS